MKLAEALAQRSDAARKLEQLRSRISDNATFQEGEIPAEDPATLLREADATVTTLEGLMRRINQTNAIATLDGGVTLTAAIARRDALRMRHSTLVKAADAASRAGAHGWGRQLRSELMTVSALDVPALRGQADAVAQELRALDLKLQEANWKVELAE
ncbi:MAG: DIP1984 family protein [Bifidobacteriaceae bacterium]|jgi:hypothetical protein|nr:DIP1984 family protein [Bifidobacteriaceae bacterium]